MAFCSFCVLTCLANNLYETLKPFLLIISNNNLYETLNPFFLVHVAASRAGTASTPLIKDVEYCTHQVKEEQP